MVGSSYCKRAGSREGATMTHNWKLSELKQYREACGEAHTMLYVYFGIYPTAKMRHILRHLRLSMDAAETTIHAMHTCRKYTLRGLLEVQS